VVAVSLPDQNRSIVVRCRYARGPRRSRAGDRQTPVARWQTPRRASPSSRDPWPGPTRTGLRACPDFTRAHDAAPYRYMDICTALEGVPPRWAGQCVSRGRRRSGRVGGSPPEWGCIICMIFEFTSHRQRNKRDGRGRTRRGSVRQIGPSGTPTEMAGKRGTGYDR
jgi:hypothetical protein